MKPTILAFDDVSKIYPQEGGQDLFALKEVSFQVAIGRSVAMVGRSGSGKSTLLHLAAGIDLPTEGRIVLAGKELAGLTDHVRTLLRRDTVGLVFQFFHLLPHLSVRDNIALPAWIAGSPASATTTRITELLERVGLADRADETTQKLSGGEMQRVAICRALLRKPPLLLADEPTGSLDDENGHRVMNLLLELARDEGSTLIYVTHSRELAHLADEVWQLHSGELEFS